jgi:TonB family protein
MLQRSRFGAPLVLLLVLLNAAFAQNIPPRPAGEPAGSIAASASPSIPTMPADPAAIMALGSKLNGLDGTEISPWHIKATYQEFDSKGKLSGSASYEEFRISDKSYKRTYTSPTFTQTDYATERGLYRSGNQDWPGREETQVQIYLTAPIPLELGVPDTALKKQDLAVGATHLRCVISKLPGVFPVESAYCFEPDRPILRLAMSPDGQSQILFNNVVLFQGRFVAQDVELTRQNRPVLTIHIDELGSLPGAIEFNPPADVSQSIGGKIVLPEGTTISLLLAQVLPVYPTSAKEMHVEGTVILHVVVGKNGAVKSADVISGPAALRASAVDAVRLWTYRPFVLLGEATGIETDVRVIFSLGSG